MARKATASRVSKGIRNNEPTTDIDFEDEADTRESLQDALRMLPGNGAFHGSGTRSLDSDRYGIDD